MDTKEENETRVSGAEKPLEDSEKKPAKFPTCRGRMYAGAAFAETSRKYTIPKRVSDKYH